MFIILTHENADFDAIASLWAAHRLHPDGVPLLPRRINRNVSQFLALYQSAYRFRQIAEWRRQHLTRVLLVDTQSLPSVRGLRDNMVAEVIDHHAHDEPKPDWVHHVETVGATTTLLIETVRQAGLAISAEEATLFLLGIYEDTGALTYDTTTPRDAAAAAWLLENGAQLSVVRRFLEIPLSPQQQALMQLLQSSAEWLNLEGQTVLLAATAAPEGFSDEISAVAHRMRDALVPSVMVLLVALPHYVQLVARSTNDALDVGELARRFGGGGHNRAAAAMLMETDLETAHRQVLDLLPQLIRPIMRVSEMMSQGVKTIAADETVREAAITMRRHGHEGYPVVDEAGKLVGLLTRHQVDRTLAHKLDHLPVSQVMRAGAVTVYPSDSITRVQQLMIEEGWGQIPVVADHNGELIIGIVTRTDLLRLMARPDQDSAESNCYELLATALSPAIWHMINAISRAADALNNPIYFVGGLVRDLLLGRDSADIDIVAEGDAIALVRALVDQYGGDLRTHKRFGTAKWLLSAEVWQQVLDGTDVAELPPQTELPSIDFVTARTEFYTEPTVLPTVQQGSIKLDLHRRDFSINTLAIRLDGAHLGELLDFYGGRRDLDNGIIRVLHSLSFIDDPTRILRAVRFEQRLGFTIEPRTLELLRSSADLLPHVTGGRIRHEIELALAEEPRIAVMERLDILGILEHICDGLYWDVASADYFRRLPRILRDPVWQAALQDESTVPAYFFLWLAPLPATVQNALLKRLRVRKTTETDVHSLNQLYLTLQQLPADPRPSEIERLLRPFAQRPRALLAVRTLFDDTPVANWLDAYQREWRSVRSALTGEDLREMGIKPGPQYAVLLDQLLAARLDGDVTDEGDERALLHYLLADA
ncbi:MAG: CBS domain-containing protein [Anaerolineae bacterium]|nr:CBS domain-containing protein [Anaerolineae bacterium]